MATLDELMKIHPPGTKVYHEQIADKGYFCPYFVTKDSLIGRSWVGPYRDESMIGTWSSTLCGWSLYQEPKKKVKKWLWVDKDRKLGTTSTKECAVVMSKGFEYPILLSDAEALGNWIKIPGTEIEVDDE